MAARRMPSRPSCRLLSSAPLGSSWGECQPAERKQADVEDLQIFVCLCRVGSFLGIVRRPGLPSLVARFASRVGRDARRGRMRDRLSPRSVWRLQAEWCRRCSSGRGPARSGGAARGRGASRRLRGRIPLAPALPPLRRPLIAAIPVEARVAKEKGPAFAGPSSSYHHARTPTRVKARRGCRKDTRHDKDARPRLRPQAQSVAASAWPQ